MNVYIFSAEVIQVNEQLSMDEIKCVEDYLNDKYKIFEKATNNPGECLNADSMDELVGWYTGESVDLVNGLWRDISGANSKALIDGNHASFISSTGADVDIAANPFNEFYLNGNPVLTGQPTTQLTFGPPVSREFTVFNLCKYQEGGTQRRLVQSEEYNSIMGHYAGNSGVSHPNTWITANQNNFGDNWVLSTNQPSLYRGNGIDFSNGVSGNPIVSRITINRGWSGAGAQTSTFACSEVIIVNKVLSESEVTCIENYLSDKYGLKPTENPGGCLDAASSNSLRGWYAPDSIDLDNNQWVDKSGYGYMNNGLISGTAETESTGEFYLNDASVLTGSTSTTVLFTPFLQPEHTVVNGMFLYIFNKNKSSILYVIFCRMIYSLQISTNWSQGTYITRYQTK